MNRIIPKKHKKGFTLVELLVSITVVAILLVALIVVLDPMSQLHKLWDSQRKRDLEQIKSALDVYYNNHGCYPTPIPSGSTSGIGLPFGQEWKDENMVLMKKIPTDPSLICVRGTCYPYKYTTDESSNCPQWNILSSSLNGTVSTASNTCLQVKNKLCYGARDIVIGTRYYYCTFSGSVDCSNGIDIQGFLSNSPNTTIAPSPVPCNNCDPNEYPGKKLYDIRDGHCNEVIDPPYTYCDSSCSMSCGL